MHSKVFMALVFAIGLANLEAADRPAPTLRDVPYVTHGHERQKLDLYLPTGDGPFPVIVWVHGGAWLAGNKSNPPAARYVNDGYAVAAINYRLSQHAIFPAQIEDCKAAVRWLRAHAGEYRLDPKRFAAWGESAGGHLVALLGTTGDIRDFDVGENLEQSSAVQAVVDGFGPTDFLQMNPQAGKSGMIDHDAPDSPESKLIGGPIRDNPDKVLRASPIHYVTYNDPPFLILHGDRDPLVPHGQSEILEAALKDANVPVQLYTVKGAGHGGFKDPKVNELLDAFFAKYLKSEK
ncbi:alpha/beta hydrolase fold domain-containing protein [bacterium]|nr:alpha/beta hydrolase fold domain-containing protein [bacterium]